MKVEHFKLRHVCEMNHKKIAYSEMSEDELIEVVMQAHSNQDAHLVSFVDENKVYGIFGLYVHWPGVADCWAITSEECVERPISFHRLTLSVIAHYERELSLHRMQITVREGYTEGMRWANKLGFKNEGLMVGYMPDKTNHYRYARTR